MRKWILSLAFVPMSVHAATLTQGVPTPITSLDPFAVTGIDTFSVIGNVIEALGRSHPLTGEIEPLLAEGWTTQPQSKTFRVKLRDKVIFHNGEILSAKNVKFTFDAYFQPAYQGAIWQGMWADVERARSRSAHGRVQNEKVALCLFRAALTEPAGPSRLHTQKTLRRRNNPHRNDAA